MHRRNILTLIALGTVIPSAVFGQERRSREERLAETAERYIEDTLAVGGIALATSQFARGRAHHRWVKKFAEYERAEQEGGARILRSFGGRTTAGAREEGREAKRDLRGLSGEGFGDTFLGGQG